jgi:hypothetical protein
MAINLGQVSSESHLRLVQEVILNPRIATTNFVVANVDPSTLASGASLTLVANQAANLLLRVARKVTMTITDAAFAGGTPLSVTVEVYGHRFGKPFSEVLTGTSTSGAAFTVTSTGVFDQVTSVIVRSTSNAATGDGLVLGIAGDGLGLRNPIDQVSDVLSIVKLISGVEQTPIVVSASSVDVANSSFNHGGTITAATDVFVVVYMRTKNKDAPGVGNNGVFA